MADECIFCAIVAGDIPADVVHRADGFLAFRDIAPKAPTHLLVIPERHVTSMSDVGGLTAEERSEMLLFIAEVARLAGLETGGYRVTTNHGARCAAERLPPALACARRGDPVTINVMQRTIELADRVAVELAGDYDQMLRSLEERLELEIDLRGNRMTLSGEDGRVEAAAAAIHELAGLVAGGQSLGPGTSRRSRAPWSSSSRSPGCSATSCCATGTSRSRRRPPGRRRYVDAIRDHTITFGIGPAGTGKTYLAVALAAAALSRREVGRIILTRPAVEAGERLGFLPGDIAAKVDPYLRPLFDALYDMLDAEKVQAYLERGQIEIAPLAFMRGRTLNDSFIILDEAQNTTPEQMKMFLTRLGYGSKMVVTGDVTQVDLPRERPVGAARHRRHPLNRHRHRVRPLRSA